MSSIIRNGNIVFMEVQGIWYSYDTTSPPLGEGAMGIVFHGIRCDTNNHVAIKKLRPEYCGNRIIRDQLKLEASIVVNHPNIIRMIGYCEEETEGGDLFVLSEYVSGITMDKHVNTQLESLPHNDRIRRIVEEYMPILDAVNYLHEMRIIHRDIKPENIMLQDGYQPVLMDLGVAKAELFYDAHLYGSIGSLPFAAPEQIVPDNVEAQVNERSDIYSLGATLAFLLKGSFPADLSDCPQTLQDAICKATHEDPEGRYEHVISFKEDLSQFLSGKKEKKKGYTLLISIGLLFIVLMMILILV